MQTLSTLPSGASLVGPIFRILPDNITFLGDVKVSLPYNRSLASPYLPWRTLSVSKLFNGSWARQSKAGKRRESGAEDYDEGMSVVKFTTRQFGVFAALQRERDR